MGEVWQQICRKYFRLVAHNPHRFGVCFIPKVTQVRVQIAELLAFHSKTSVWAAWSDWSAPTSCKRETPSSASQHSLEQWLSIDTSHSTMVFTLELITVANLQLESSHKIILSSPRRHEEPYYSVIALGLVFRAYYPETECGNQEIQLGYGVLKIFPNVFLTYSVSKERNAYFSEVTCHGLMVILIF